jgi:hypothetical protein
MKIILTIKMLQDDESGSDYESNGSSFSEGEYKIETINTLAILENELSSFEPIFKKIEGHIQRVETKIHNTRLFYPIDPDMESWCINRGLVIPFKLDDWLSTLLKDATSVRVSDRMINFGENNLLFIKGEISFFDLLRKIPSWLNYTV